MKLHPLNINQDSKLWCSIAALSAITGVCTEHSRQLLREVLSELNEANGTRRQLKGVRVSELELALKKMVIDLEPIYKNFTKVDQWKVSLARYLLKYRPPQEKAALAIIQTSSQTYHYITFDQEKIIDSHYPNGVSFYDYKYIETPVCLVWELSDISLSDL